MLLSLIILLLNTHTHTDHTKKERKAKNESHSMHKFNDTYTFEILIQEFCLAQFIHKQKYIHILYISQNNFVGTILFLATQM